MGAVNNSQVDYWLQEDNLFLLTCWARDYSLQEVAKKVGVASKTLWVWRNTYPEIEKACAKGREALDYEVENALLKRALGYTVTESKTILKPGAMDAATGRAHQPEILRIERTEKHVQPDPMAAIMWLNNRKPEQWKRNRDNMIELNEDQSNITVNIIRHAPDKQQGEEVHSTDDDTWNVDSVEQEDDWGDYKDPGIADNNKSDNTSSWLDESVSVQDKETDAQMQVHMSPEERKKGSTIKGPKTEEEEWLEDSATSDAWEVW